MERWRHGEEMNDQETVNSQDKVAAEHCRMNWALYVTAMRLERHVACWVRDM